jgi:hypothetical protein
VLGNNIETMAVPFLVVMMFLQSLFVAEAQPEYLLYEDPQGRFTIEHPADWQAYPAEERDALSAVEFLNVDVSMGRILGLDVRIVPDISEEITNLGLKNFVELATESLSADIPSFNLEQSVECSTYVLSGNQACSVVYARTIEDTPAAVMQVTTFAGNNAYMLTYTGTINGFYQYVPIADQMISSFRIL